MPIQSYRSGQHGVNGAQDSSGGQSSSKGHCQYWLSWVSI
nr:MAG TPA: hypothetical protein [Caudoviricetes sp.]